MPKHEIVLASSSRYRRELLHRLLSDFIAESPGVDESAFHSHLLTPEQLASCLAFEKAQAVASRHPDAVVIGSDQLADLDHRVLGKPGTEEAAVQQLMAMSGRWHRLLTAVCVLGPHKRIDFLIETRLKMRTLSLAEAVRYVGRDLPLDCAGSYRIESLGIALFEQIQTDDFTAIMGLPLIRLTQSLRDFGVEIP